MDRRIALGPLLGLLAACGGVEPRAAEPQVQDQSGVSAAPGRPAEPPTVFHGRAHGVAVELRVCGGDWGLVSTAQRKAFAELSRLEDVVNLWDPASELARWNDGPPAGRRVSAELAEVVALALDLCGATGGAFDPTVGALLASRGHYGEPVPLAWAPEELVGCDRVRLVATPDGPVLERRHPGVRLDLSGIAKGWAADRVKAQLVAAGVTNALLDLGSSTVIAWGPGPDGRGWGYDHPFAGGMVGGEPYWWLADEGASTSSRTPTSRDPADLTGVHIVDPDRAGFVEQDAFTVMVRAANAATADAWATAVAVTGRLPEEGSGVTAARFEPFDVEVDTPAPASDAREPQTTR